VLGVQGMGLVLISSLNYVRYRLHLMRGNMDVHRIYRAMLAYLLFTSLVLQPAALNRPFATRITAHQSAHSHPLNIQRCNSQAW
jgi:hypothetical protein